MTIIKHRQVV